MYRTLQYDIKLNLSDHGTDRSSLATRPNTCLPVLPSYSTNTVHTGRKLYGTRAFKLRLTYAGSPFERFVSLLAALARFSLVTMVSSSFRYCFIKSARMTANVSRLGHALTARAKKRTLEETKIVACCWGDRYLSRGRQEGLCVRARTSKRQGSWCTRSGRRSLTRHGAFLERPLKCMIVLRWRSTVCG